MTEEQTFSSVWDALADTAQEAAHLKVRSVLMIELNESIKKWPGTDTEKAARLGITKPRFSNLKSGRVDLFSLDALVDLAASAGLVVSMHLDAA
ncbi:helix-turn-helix domain-containing protein [Pseudomonas lijiangensis]|uniref:XRE family transcriptional regulator n=1 Tax=Pseudomonas lijiangensis TaxID=2995658 RepID=A0ABX8HUJ3_9PSED|nr:MULTISPECIES: XRE family transcriptional regulator [Pseudomonas syringae group]MBX8500843.1 XRE family transcriptional regulator [Pseudomonas lijiangensis]MBX8505848.1 XRE family transcriptional regulator [Pseudomonas lijiangensis]MBX8520277.1 XRE family transcriptional regulator [Pseudomonas cichorii]MBX8549589.1 XRE family transcriptional regulator [Pseudomonas cichorii]MBX8583771.1 XRE family transcriptional regulator [Pseudomonas cichorii]